MWRYKRKCAELTKQSSSFAKEPAGHVDFAYVSEPVTRESDAVRVVNDNTATLPSDGRVVKLSWHVHCPAIDDNLHSPHTYITTLYSQAVLLITAVHDW